MAVETPTPISELPSSDRLAVADAGTYKSQNKEYIVL